jgi:ribosome maturation factor RimP
MDIVKQIKAWGLEHLPSELFIVEVDWKPAGQKVIVYLDGDEGVNIEACRTLNRYLSEKLDEVEFTETAYTLEVSSPGADRPLLMHRQYHKHMRRVLEVKLNDGTLVEGKLDEIDEEKISLQLPDKKKRYSPSSTYREVAFADIASTMVQISFK